jgi:hypothetical protein
VYLHNICFLHGNIKHYWQANMAALVAWNNAKADSSNPPQIPSSPDAETSSNQQDEQPKQEDGKGTSTLHPFPFIKKLPPYAHICRCTQEKKSLWTSLMNVSRTSDIWTNGSLAALVALILPNSIFLIFTHICKIFLQICMCNFFYKFVKKNPTKAWVN